MQVGPAAPLTASTERPRMAGREAVATTAGLMLGEWSLTRAAWTDRHRHEEVNHVLEGELLVTCDGATVVLPAGASVVVPAGSLARYEAPVYARMLFVYGPSADGHATADWRYDELP
jgi:ethanolamine utilization protein EutQ (cupin superfamily)